MNKIPVVNTVAFAYNFLFTRIGNVVGITTLPALLAAGVDYLMRSYISSEETQAAAGMNLLISITGMVTTIFVWAVAAVGVTRAALGLPLGSGAYFFPVSMTELRMFGAMLRFWLGVLALLILASLVTSLAVMLAGVPLEGPPESEPSAAILIAGIIAWVAFGYAVFTIVRMGFPLSATVICESNGGLQRSHDLARGNFWRIAVVLLAIGAPIIILYAVAGAVILQASALDYRQVIQDEGMDELIKGAEQLIADNLLIWELFNIVIFIVAAGLIFSAGAYAYRALTAKPLSDTNAP